MTQAHSLQPYPQARSADADTGSLGESLLHFGQGQVGLLPQRGLQLLLHRSCQATGRTMASLLGPFLPSRLQLLGTNLFAVSPTDPKSLRQLLQAPLSGLVGLQHLAAQIVGNRLAASIDFAEFVTPTPLPLSSPAYSSEELL